MSIQHYVYRLCQNRGGSRIIKILIKAKVVATIEAVPNAIILWKNIVRQLTEGGDAIISGRSANHFDLNDEFTEEEMIEAFKRVSDMKFDIIEDDD